MIDLTAARTVDTFPTLVDLVDQFAIDDEWTIAVTPALNHRAVLRWDRITLTVRDLGDLNLARVAVAERAAARRFLNTLVAATRRDLRLGKPVRCHYCRTSGPVHTPNGQECRDARLEREWSQADD